MISYGLSRIGMPQPGSIVLQLGSRIVNLNIECSNLGFKCRNSLVFYLVSLGRLGKH